MKLLKSQIGGILHKILGFTSIDLEDLIYDVVQNNNKEETLSILINKCNIITEDAEKLIVEFFPVNNHHISDNKKKSNNQDDEDYIDDEEITKLRKLARLKYLKEREIYQLELAKRIQDDKINIYKTLELNIVEAEDSDIQRDAKRIKLIEKIVEDRAKGNELKQFRIKEDNESADLKENITQKPLKWESNQLLKSFGDLSATDSSFNLEMKFIDDNGDFIDFVGNERIDSVSEDDWWNEDTIDQDILKEIKLHQSVEKSRRRLPIYKFRTQLMQTIQINPIIILVGETGSGKTTQLTQYLDDLGYSNDKSIICTQPRRVAAISIANRVAFEKRVILGEEVGYSVRFDNKRSDKTKILYVTDGILLQYFMADPTLSNYSVIIIDEAHERSLHTDLLFIFIKDLIRMRKHDLRVIIASATIEAEKFAEYFDDAPIFKIPGRSFPVNIFYSKNPELNYVEKCAITAVQLHVSKNLGNDILIFLPGQNEISECAEIIEKILTKINSNFRNNLEILYLYSALPIEEQTKVFLPAQPNTRRIILATNIAETSLTIDNITYVIDSGLVKQNVYNPYTNVESLAITSCSQAACNQRAGRAGRTREGFCFRIFTKKSWDVELEKTNPPEIQRSNMLQTILFLKALGIDDIVNLDYLDKPPTKCLETALNDLHMLGALNLKGELTKKGQMISMLPTSPKVAAMILASKKFFCSDNVLMIAAMLEVAQQIFHCPKGKEVDFEKTRSKFMESQLGDHILFNKIFIEWKKNDYSKNWCSENFVQYKTLMKAYKIYEQLIDILPKIEIELNNSDNFTNILKCVIYGYFNQIAIKNKLSTFNLLDCPTAVYLHPSSSLFVKRQQKETPTKLNIKLVIYHEIIHTNQDYLKTVSRIEPEWLLELFPQYFNEKLNVLLNKRKNFKRSANK